jgi:hypothetical protein
VYYIIYGNDSIDFYQTLLFQFKHTHHFYFVLITVTKTNDERIQCIKKGELAQHHSPFTKTNMEEFVKRTDYHLFNSDVELEQFKSLSFKELPFVV